jgi:hypothetical protein
MPRRGLRAAGWPAPEDPGRDDDAELHGCDLICDRLLDEVDWLHQCADWLTHLHAREFPGGQLAPRKGSSRSAHVMADLPQVAAIVQRIAADVDELARARRVADLGAAAAALPDRRAGRRRRVAEPDLDFREFCRRSKLPQPSPSASETCSPLNVTGAAKPISPPMRRTPVPIPPAGTVRMTLLLPAVFSKLDGLMRFLAPSLPVTIRPELAATWPDVYHHQLEQSSRVVGRLERGEDLSDASLHEPRE